MGTRNLTCVVLNGEYVVAQYGQWDGYPSGMGSIVLKFVRDILSDPKNDLKFRGKLQALKELSQKEAERRYLKLGADKDAEFVSMDISNKYKVLYPETYRDIGAGILERIFTARKGLKIKKGVEFAGDSLFCEWGYVVDLDNRVLEVYEGFNKTPTNDGDRFHEYTEEGGKYAPILLVMKFDFDNLPSDEEFVNLLEKEKV